MSLLKEINEIASSPADLRKFGITMGIVFGLFGGYSAWRGHSFWIYRAGAGAFFLVFGLIVPTRLKPIQKVWMTLALMMGWVMARVILCVLFFLAITPIGLILRAAGKDLLDIKPGVTRSSYWKVHKAQAKEDYENQF